MGFSTIETGLKVSEEVPILKKVKAILFSSFRCVSIVTCSFLGNFPASEF